MSCAQFYFRNSNDALFAPQRAEKSSVNLMLFIHSSGRIVFGKAFDLQNGEEIPVPQSLQERLFDNDLLVRHPNTESSVTGIILLPEGPMLISSRPILPSEVEGPIRGSLVMGRYLNSTEVKRLAETTNLSLTVRRFDDQEMPLDFREVRSSLEGAPILVRPLSEESIAGYALLKDIYGEPALVLRVDMPRDIFKQGQASMRYFLLSLLAVGLVFGVVTLLPLEKYVLSRLARLGKNVSSIGASGDLSARVNMTGGDELSSLADEINGMLEALEQSGEALQFEREQLLSIFDSINEIIYVSDPNTHEILYVNKALQDAFQKSLVGGACYKEFQDLDSPCEFCTNEIILKEKGKPYQWEYHNPILNRDYMIVDRIIKWPDGRDVRFEFAVDITERKRAEEELQHTTENLRKALGATIQAIALIVETKDPYTAGHQRRVADLARAIATEMGLAEEQIGGIRMAGVIHDIGKIYVPGEILSKPGRLGDIEFGLIKTHPQVGYDILKTIEFPWPVAQIVLQHHERVDGSGYPQGLSGEEIMLEARIMAVADVVEAMASYRPYRPAHSIDEALEEISQNRGVLYDPEVVDTCLRLFTEEGFKFE
jgi:HD-GYP domain-containing protein (c-di-GMP phosphodiesterase class II)/HAMP domain-containing protein